MKPYTANRDNNISFNPATFLYKVAARLIHCRTENFLSKNLRSYDTLGQFGFSIFLGNEPLMH